MAAPMDDSIIVEDSRNLDEGAPSKEVDVAAIKNDSSKKVFEEQGIFVEPGKTTEDQPAKDEDNFDQGLFNQGGIEIIPTEKEDLL